MDKYVTNAYGDVKNLFGPECTCNLFAVDLMLDGRLCDTIRNMDQKLISKTEPVVLDRQYSVNNCKS